MKNCVIYKITNPFGHAYIGKTTNWRRRYNNYKSLKGKGQPALYASFFKYGFENHTFEILEQNIQEENLCNKEQIWIKKEGTFGNGLNCTEGGEGISGCIRTEEFKRKASERMTGEKNHFFGKHHSEESRQSISNSGSGENCSEETRKRKSESHKGKPHSEETRRKQSEGLKGKPKTEEHKRNMSAAHKGIPLSEEHKLKLSEAGRGEKNHNFGKKIPEEVIRKRTESRAKNRALKLISQQMVGK